MGDILHSRPFYYEAVVLEYTFLLVAEADRETLLGGTTMGFRGPLVSSKSLVDVDFDELSSGVRLLFSHLERGAKSSSSSVIGAFPSLCYTNGTAVSPFGFASLCSWLDAAAL